MLICATCCSPRFCFWFASCLSALTQLFSFFFLPDCLWLLVSRVPALSSSCVKCVGFLFLSFFVSSTQSMSLCWIEFMYPVAVCFHPTWKWWILSPCLLLLSGINPSSLLPKLTLPSFSFSSVFPLIITSTPNQLPNCSVRSDNHSSCSRGARSESMERKQTKYLLHAVYESLFLSPENLVAEIR